MSRAAEIAREGKVRAKRHGRMWYRWFEDVEARKLALEAAPPPPFPRSPPFRITDYDTGNVRTADYLSQGKLRYAATLKQQDAVAAMQPGDVLRFRSDRYGRAKWKVECLEAPPGVGVPPVPTR